MYKNILLIIISISISTQVFSQLISKYYNEEILKNKKVKEVHYFDGKNEVIDSFNKRGYIVKKKFINSDNIILEAREYVYSDNLLVKELISKRFEHIFSREMISQSKEQLKTEYDEMKSSGINYYFYDTIHSNRLDKVIGFDWGRYTPNNIITLKIDYFYESDTLPNLITRAKKIINNMYIYDSQDTIIKKQHYTYDSNNNIVMEVTKDKKDLDVETNYISYIKNSSFISSYVQYLPNSNSPDFEVNIINMDGLIEKISKTHTKSNKNIENKQFTYVFY